MNNLGRGLYNFLSGLNDDIENNRWLKVIYKSILMIIVGVSVAFFTLWLFKLVYKYWVQIVLTVGGLIYAIALLRSMFPKREKPQGQPVQEASIILQYDPITLENTYKLVRAGLCFVIGEIYEVIGVRKPASYSQMDAPTHYTIVSNVPIYHLLVSKTCSEIDTYSVMGILQNAIEQKLNNNEFNGISQAVFFYNGQAYPSIMVDKVLDCGNMLQIDIAIASEYYCKYRARRIYNNMNNSGPGNHNDKDF